MDLFEYMRKRNGVAASKVVETQEETNNVVSQPEAEVKDEPIVTSTQMANESEPAALPWLMENEVSTLETKTEDPSKTSLSDVNSLPVLNGTDTEETFTAASSDIDPEDETNDEEEVESEDDENEEDDEDEESEDEISEVKEEKPSNKAKSSAKKSTSKKAVDEEVTCPVTIVTPYGLFPFGGFNEKRKMSEVIEYMIHSNGLAELKTSVFDLILSEKNNSLVYMSFSSSSYMTSPDTILEFKKGQSITVCYGPLVREYSYESFDEIRETGQEPTVGDAFNRFTDENPSLKGECYYDLASGVIIPLPKKEIYAKDDKPVISLPINVGTLNKTTSFTMASEKVSVKELFGALLPESNYKGLAASNLILLKYGKGDDAFSTLLYCSHAVHGKDVYKISDAKTLKKREETYALPLNIKLFFEDDILCLTNGEFGEKKRLTKKEVIEYLGENYPVFTGRDVTLAYVKKGDESILYTFPVSNSKGACKTSPKLKAMREKYRNMPSYNNGLGTFSIKDGILSFMYEKPKIPVNLLSEIVEFFRSQGRKEAIAQIYQHDGEFVIIYPNSKCSQIEVKYDFSLDAVMNMKLICTIHSHHVMQPVFSSIDDEDEIYPGIYGVVGLLDSPTDYGIKLRAGMNGYFKSLDIRELFKEE